jgi:hypothetical protein
LAGIVIPFQVVVWWWVSRNIRGGFSALMLGRGVTRRGVEERDDGGGAVRASGGEYGGLWANLEGVRHLALTPNSKPVYAGMGLPDVCLGLKARQGPAKDRMGLDDVWFGAEILEGAGSASVGKKDG